MPLSALKRQNIWIFYVLISEIVKVKIDFPSMKKLSSSLEVENCVDFIIRTAFCPDSYALTHDFPISVRKKILII